jgi:hypothetical protein
MIPLSSIEMLSHGTHSQARRLPHRAKVGIFERLGRRLVSGEEIVVSSLPAPCERNECHLIPSRAPTNPRVGEGRSPARGAIVPPAPGLEPIPVGRRLAYSPSLCPAY